jgi:predicted dehydrogenase
MYARAITQTFKDYGEIVALCDNNEGRMRLSARTHLGTEDKVRLYNDAEFDLLVNETKPDVVIVTTLDSFHDRFIVRAMEQGCDAITEKPMTIDEKRCQSILDAIKKTGRTLRVAFNYRYSPPRTQVKKLLMSGIIGRIVSVDFHWLLDTRHGADYFRRWHRNKSNSGGLMVHKATHHFDLVNWWISSVPKTVYATGSREFYTPATAEHYGLSQRSERCLNCPEKKSCPFYLDIEKPGLKEMYLDNEKFDGYFRDQCVFSDRIDIEDSMSLSVTYRNGARMSYSLNAFCPKEGYEIRFNGTRGRLEHTTLESSYVSGEAGSKVHETDRKNTSIWVFPHFKEPIRVGLWATEGGHGGGDDPMLQDIFHRSPPADEFNRSAGVSDGAWSILTGVAANRSMASGKTVEVEELVSGLEMPAHTQMPEW